MDKTNFLFSGDLITGGEVFDWLKSNLPKAHEMSSIASCYVKEEAIKRLLAPSLLKGRLLARWRPGDLIEGSSDLSAYEVAREKGWDFYISQNFHGKVYRLPGVGTLVGSANATLSGLSIYTAGNDEVSTIVANTDKNKLVVDGLFKNATLVTPDLFIKLSNQISIAKSNSKEAGSGQLSEWPIEISKLFKRPDQGRLFVSDCFSSPWSNSPTPSDLSLLGLTSIPYDENLVSVAIGQTKIYQWLTHSCADAGGRARYGDLTHRLHNNLLDDPIPYRSSIKDLLSNLLSWVEKYKQKEVKISTPYYAQVVELI